MRKIRRTASVAFSTTRHSPPARRSQAGVRAVSGSFFSAARRLLSCHARPTRSDFMANSECPRDKGVQLLLGWEIGALARLLRIRGLFGNHWSKQVLGCE